MLISHERGQRLLPHAALAAEIRSRAAGTHVRPEVSAAADARHMTFLHGCDAALVSFFVN
jgi:hypothetical protein